MRFNCNNKEIIKVDIKRINKAMEINAPLTQDLACSGYLVFQTKYKINPAKGMKKLSKPYSKLYLSDIIFTFFSHPQFGQ